MHEIKEVLIKIKCLVDKIIHREEERNKQMDYEKWDHYFEEDILALAIEIKGEL